MCGIEISYSTLCIESGLLKTNGLCKETHKKFCHIADPEQNS